MMRTQVQFRQGPDKPWSDVTVRDFKHGVELVRAWGADNARTADGQHWYDDPYMGPLAVNNKWSPTYLMTKEELEQEYPILAPFRLVPWPDTANERWAYKRAETAKPPPKTLDLSDWRTWRNDAPGHCACGIVRAQCEYHR